jgi:hypothetical protein
MPLISTDETREEKGQKLFGYAAKNGQGESFLSHPFAQLVKAIF